MLEKNLEQIGLNEKEAKVYLASLELGQAVVQNIAKQAGVNRATTYFVIENLMKRGLMSSFYQGKKQYFVAADPDSLLSLAEQERSAIERRQEHLKKLLPQLQSINNKQKDRPVVRYYEGKEGIASMVDEFLKSKDITVNMAYSADSVKTVFTNEERARWRRKRIEGNIQAKVIYTYSEGNLPRMPNSIQRRIPMDKFPISCDIAIYNDKVRIASLKDRLVGIIIEDKEIAKSLKAILDLAWEAAEKYDNQEK